jgi:hypothetical protein
VGWPIQFLPNGNEDNALAAVVTAQGENGQVKLNYQYIGGGNPVSSNGYVRHCEDPWTTERVEMIRRNGQGTWRFIPGMEFRAPARTASNSSSKKTLEPAGK